METTAKLSDSAHADSLLAEGERLVAAMTAAEYGTKEARELAKRALAHEKTVYAWGRQLDTEYREAREPGDYSSCQRARTFYDLGWQLKQTRIGLNTMPLPVPPSQLPCYRYAKDAQLVPGPQDPSEYKPGDIVAIHGHGAMRDALVLKVGRSNINVAFTTPTAVADTAKRRGPNAEPPHTRGTVKLQHVFNHRPAAPAAEPTTEAAPAATNRKEAPVATSTKKGDSKKAAAPRQPKHPQLTIAQAEAEMAKTKPAFDAYEQARIAIRDTEGLSAADRTKHERTMEDNRQGFSTYWRLYNDERIAAKRRKAREDKKAKAEADAKKKADAKAAKATSGGKA